MAGPSDKFVDTPDAVDSAEYQAFLDDFSHQLTRSEGEILRGHVLSVSEKEVIVDIGRKIEGLVPASQFPLIEGKPAVRTGDEIEVMIDRRGEPVEGYILLSYERPHRLHVWEHLEKAAAEQTPVTGRVVNSRHFTVRKGGGVEARRIMRVFVEPETNRVFRFHVRVCNWVTGNPLGITEKYRLPSASHGEPMEEAAIAEQAIPSARQAGPHRAWADHP